MWDLSQLRAEVERAHGREQRDLLSPVLEAIWSRLFAANYHFHEAKRLLQPFADKASESQVSAVGLVLGADPEEYEKLDGARRQAGAHIVAMIQALHAVSDNMAHAIYFALNMAASNPLEDRKIAAWRVAKALPAGELREALNALTNGDDATYLSDAVNFCKHRALVGTPFSVNFTDKGPPHGLKLNAFKYEGRENPEKWVEEYLPAEFARVAQGVQRIGAALNAAAAPRRSLREVKRRSFGVCTLCEKITLSSGFTTTVVVIVIARESAGRMGHNRGMGGTPKKKEPRALHPRTAVWGEELPGHARGMLGESGAMFKSPGWAAVIDLNMADGIVRAVSTPRLKPYGLGGPGIEPAEAVVRHARNIVLSEALYPTLHVLEVVMRNSIHNGFATHYNDPEWFDRPWLRDGHRRLVEEARESLAARGKPVNPNSIVAELSFGFWCGMFHGSYDGRGMPWPAVLPTVLPRVPKSWRSRDKIRDRVEDARLIRNRVFHHEPISSNLRALSDRKREMSEVVGWFSPEARSHLEALCRFKTVMAERPELSPPEPDFPPG